MNSKELARLIGVSQSTISRALNGSKQISEQRRQEICELAKKHNFEFNLNARNLRNQTSNFVGILLPTKFDNFMEDDYRTMQFTYLYRELSKHDYDPILLNGEELSRDASALERAIKKRQLAGLILWRRIESDEVIAYLKTLKIPLFAMTRCNEKMQFIPSVSVDSYRMGYLVGEHFAARGFGRIGFILIRNHQSSLLTLQGFRDALEKQGGTLRQEDIYFTGTGVESGYQTIMEIRDRIREYDAIFANNDYLAMGAISALRSLGLSVPEDIAVAGNNNAPASGWYAPALTTVETALDLQAEMSCARLAAMIRGEPDPMEEKHYVIPPRLVVRESCP